jgi:hypothetical protein
MERDVNKAALLAAVSALGLSLGVTIPKTALADESPKEHSYQKPTSQQIKIDGAYLKHSSNQIKGESDQVKGESHQLKLDSQHIKGEGQQIKGESQQVKGDVGY